MSPGGAEEPADQNFPAGTPRTLPSSGLYPLVRHCVVGRKSLARAFLRRSRMSTRHSPSRSLTPTNANIPGSNQSLCPPLRRPIQLPSPHTHSQHRHEGREKHASGAEDLRPRPSPPVLCVDKTT
ncbi:hypothetical protein FQN60_007716 [Etheostoma spectabile]|uniref:Uncharacterized protein n=1 Tax=Etheostoma spectabile TaxID=54343 RepID=A0A5J5CWJ0_9PERO|nr:hypothetical protein FQN60_007716 [Etheostoma spectabile]